MSSDIENYSFNDVQKQDRKNSLIFISRTEVQKITGMSKSWIYQAMAEDRFPRPVACSIGTRRWVLSEIHAWMHKKILNRSTDF